LEVILKVKNLGYTMILHVIILIVKSVKKNTAYRSSKGQMNSSQRLSFLQLLGTVA